MILQKKIRQFHAETQRAQRALHLTLITQHSTLNTTPLTCIRLPNICYLNTNKDTMNQLLTKSLMGTTLAIALLLSVRAFAQKPNIIYIMSDDMGYGDLSGYGRKEYQTPHLDKLASQGMKFTQAYSAGSLCTPTRVGFITGRYPARTAVGLMEPLTPTKRDSAYGISMKDHPLPSIIKKAGYETALIGKWHLGFRPEFSPNSNGFDYFFGFHSGASDYVAHTNDGRMPDLYENGQSIHVDGYLTDIFTQKAVSFLQQKHDKPFFLVLNYNAPHWPWQGRGDKAYHDTMRLRMGGSPQTYAAMMESLDEGVGAVMKALDDAGLTANTLVIFTNDNGGERFSDNGGLSKGKLTLWEGGIRVPAFVRWPGKIHAGTVSTQPVITMDWSATIAAAAGASVPGREMDGINLLPILKGNRKKEIDRTLYWRNAQRNQQKAVREGNWKYLMDDKGEYLFDLATDPGEKNDLKSAKPDVFEKLKAKYAAWEKTVLAPIPL